MRYLASAFVFWLIVTGTLHAGSDTRYGALRDSLAEMTIDSSTAKSVEGVFVQHGIINLAFDTGVIAELTTISGRRLGYVFQGTGTAMFTPNLVTERVNLERFYGQQVFMEEFTQAVILCTDNRISSQLSGFPAADIPAKLDGVVSEHWSSLVLQYRNLEIDDGLARSMLNGLNDDHFMVKILKPGDLSAFMLHQPYEVEPYKLFLEFVFPNIKDPFLVNQCPSPDGEQIRNDLGVHPTDVVSTEQHNLQIRFDAALDMEAVDEIYMEVRADSIKWLDIGLHPGLTVDSIRIRRGEVLNMFRAAEGFTTWIELPSWYSKGERIELEIYYHGSMIMRIRDRTVLISSITWYPSHSYMHRAYYDMRFSYLSSVTLASIGSCVDFQVGPDTTHARWVTGAPVRNASFHIGYFRRESVPTEAGIPQASILYNTAGHVDAVALDIKQALVFFTKFFGPLPIDSLIATELPGYHGEAFPGLLHLSHLAFDYSSWSGSDFFEEQFVAHEVAHQWWGIAVDFSSYRDQWLSEGFAMYSCLLYSQLAASDRDRFFTLLTRYRSEILEFGKKTLGTDDAPPAIALGHRVNNGAKTAGAYNTFVYFKGAWVLHMLRNLLLDLNSMNEDAFMSVMKSFYRTYKNKSATTEDFRRSVEEVVGRDMGWFFNQWVYSNEIPTYTWAWRSIEQPDGTYQNQIRIKQSGVPETFRMYIPIKVEYGDDTFVRYRVQMIGGEAVIDLPASGMEIDNLTFNEFESVLCESDEESF